MPLTQLAARLRPLLDRAIRATGAAMGNIQVLDQATGSLRIAVHHGFRDPFLEFFREVTADDAACGAALKYRRRTVVGDVTISTVYTPAARDAMIAAGAMACQSTPIVIDGQVIGILSTHFRTPHLPFPRELKRLDAIAREVAAVILDIGIVADPAVDARSLRDELHDASAKTKTIPARGARAARRAR